MSSKNAMETIKRSKLWKRTLGGSGGDATAKRFRKRLRSSFEKFHERVTTLSNEISSDLKSLTVHDISHIDALWDTADTVIGDEYPLTPTEAFVLGGAFLVHDLGLALASYPNGVAELKADEVWQDTVIKVLRNKLGRGPNAIEITTIDKETERIATEEVLRLRHAKRAEDLATVSYQHAKRDPEYFLLEDVDLRKTYGKLIGQIAYSHWWPIQQLEDDQHLNREIGAFSDGPKEWDINPLKLAIILRTTDACHLDSRRAPGFLRALRKPSGVAELHWRIQELLQKPRAVKKRIQFSATNPISIEDVAAWWVGFDLLQLADRELRDAEIVLSNHGLPELAVHGVSGCSSPKHLAKHIPTLNWVPVNSTVQVADVGSLVKKIGGEGLYGSNPTVPLRELIQNARDAVVGRRTKFSYASDWGKISVRLASDGDNERLDVEDNGLGMSESLLAGPFLDFGTSYWTSFLCSHEHPGLLAKGFEPQGTYGIGFFLFSCLVIQCGS